MVEESLWALTYALIGSLLLGLSNKLKGPIKYACYIAILGSALYVLFMLTVDVPMYLTRLSEDAENLKHYFSLLEGIKDLNTRWVVTHSIDQWRYEIPWMSLYFSAAVWVSLLLCYVPFPPLHQKD